MLHALFSRTPYRAASEAMERHRRAGAAAHTVITVGVAARIHYLLVYHTAAAAARPGLAVALVLSLVLVAGAAATALGALHPGALRLYAGAAMYAGIAALLGQAYQGQPWDFQVGNVAMFGGLSLWCVVTLLGYRRDLC